MKRFHLLSLFPDYFRSPLEESMLGRAQENGLLKIELVNMRDFTQNRHKRVDDRPYGGGPGMVLQAEPVIRAIRSVRQPESRVIYLSPQGKPLTAKRAQELAQYDHLILLCGHYEGIDQRALDIEVDEELSIGDYVLTSGCPAALVLVDTIARFIPGVLGHEEANLQDSFQNGLLDWPHFTRPELLPTEYGGGRVPPELLQGDPKIVAAWRGRAALEKTQKVRPELLKGAEHEQPSYC
jgi:tRNA (guanine37-N1)-methyltransferase